ncbi:ABC transporter permease [Chitinibacter sp. S2-10]|uniref:ABC transporter permease n=1 Tax=Chitinibacter sp. S2-10 TaxID=3373597 RepID=UPI003977925F
MRPRFGQFFVLLSIARTHLTSRLRATLVSLGGVVLGVAFFLAVSALMQGSEKDFIKRLIDSSPHITISDENRNPAPQAADLRWPDAAVAIRHAKPPNETRGIRSYQQKLAYMQALDGVKVAPVLVGSAVLQFAGRQQGVSLSGVVPSLMREVSFLQDKFIAGELASLDSEPGGIIIGEKLAQKFSLRLGSTISVTVSSDNARENSAHSLRVVGIFRSGNSGYDETQTFVLLKQAQALLERPQRINRFILQLKDPYQARELAGQLETALGYKAVSWLEASEDILSLLIVRNLIMFSVVGAILVVASFGIYNTISTFVIEKTRDIAILKAMGFHANDVLLIFLLEGLMIGVIGSLIGLLFGAGLMQGLSMVEIKPPGASQLTNLPVWWGSQQFIIAAGFALASCLAASYLPARRASRLHPVDVLRGAT